MSDDMLDEDDLGQVTDVVVLWLTMNCGSNVELANLSNVCRGWREVVRTAILRSCQEHNGEHQPPLKQLLLPSMMLTAPENRRATLRGPTADPCFCLAWFHPNGILTQQVPLEETYEEFDDADDYAHDGARISAHLGRYTYHGSPSVFRPHPRSDTDSRIGVHTASEPFQPSAIVSLAASEDESTPPPPPPSAQTKLPPSQVPSSSNTAASPSQPFFTVPSSDVRRCLSSSPHRLRHPRSPPGSWGDNGQNASLDAITRMESPNAPSSHFVAPSSPGVFSIQDHDVPRTHECTYQWSGYSLPHEVLLPFGFSPVFVRDVLGEASSHETFDSSRNGSNPPSVRAVRGATLARPDGYCLCWDDIDQTVERASTMNDLFPTEQQSPPGTPPSPEEIRRRQHRLLHINQLRRELRRKRKDRLRELLPRVLRAPQDKDFHRQQQQQQRHVRGRRPPEDVATQPCVQFLNVDRSRAVRFRTPPFQCGTIRSPITIFCVAIATEDGCFLSGLQRQMELGHMYPTTARDKLIDRSPICIAMAIGAEGERPDDWRDFGTAMEQTENSTSASPTPLRRVLSRRRIRSFDSDSTEDSEQSMDDNGIPCSCDFGCVGDRMFAATPGMTRTLSTGTDQMDEKGNSLVVRGSLGPGRWHCYTAVLDGITSQLRIDGVDEPLHLGSEDSASDIDPSNLEALNNYVSELDGITLGSDHTLEMSLCLGEGDDGEGEGAIAEVAVFKGRMDLSDIEHLEDYLMRSHGISSETLNNGERVDRWQDDEWRRQAQALMEVSLAAPKSADVTHLGINSSVPLRYAARTRSVAWNRTNEVTGNVTEVGRIGTARGSGRDGSDW